MWNRHYAAPVSAGGGAVSSFEKHAHDGLVLEQLAHLVPLYHFRQVVPELSE